jgi:phosphoglycerate dehydrogenase-like enzyme
VAPSARPVAAFALTPDLVPDLFPEDVSKRIHDVAEVVPFSVAALAPVEVLLTGWGCPRLTEDVLAGAPRLRAVIHAAGSVKAHVTQAVYDRGILVSSAAAANAPPVAEYTVAVLVLGLKRVFQRAREYSAGAPATAHVPGDRVGLTGTTIGVVGASKIGRLVVELLKPYDVRVLLHDPYLGDREIAALGAEPSDLDTLCAIADAVTVHAPELPETRHLFDDRRLSLMRDGALLVNTARGALVDTEALTRHCASGRLDAVLDVSTPEPLPAGHPLMAMPNVLVTPHMAGSRGRELRLLGAYAAAELERYAAGLPLHGLVDPRHLPRIA